ncbi:serine hydrolase domain-containing protein [Chryseobacterium daecheongense]|uniref:Class A beta-lactamase-related serine hydrolase n=1 Tax=Chryseobacterium daecheongense TaxID=192389 RepID=A0A3N0W4L1_9FLAO|nr:serine hydrolase domain-containing protein [Chryseobacterium daecheongense]ROH99997.1 class A beta-lactamase-related serine hydrolase [Chryseobacterium daecheongense]TDX95067.1 CubicO group peptidase (beta-lactamase class C family) [Chryseobacterium daecheongense]
MKRSSILLTLFFFASVFSQNITFSKEKLNLLNEFNLENKSRAFLIYQNGKMINEKYFGKKFLNQQPFDEHSEWYWASAGKSLTAVLIGIAQQENLLHINDPVSQYLGKWTGMDKKEEDKITIKHLLTMTSGLDYTKDQKCESSQCYVIKNPAGSFWYYDTSAYSQLAKVIEKASHKTIDQYTSEKLAGSGISGKWIKYENGLVFSSNAKAFLQFGKLVLNKGKLDGKVYYQYDDYFRQMTDTSQNLNPSYGYLWWLNGKSSIRIPGIEKMFNQSLVPNAPKDMLCALGKNGQILDIIPSQNLIIIRMGENPNLYSNMIKFHRELWEKILE